MTARVRLVRSAHSRSSRRSVHVCRGRLPRSAMTRRHTMITLYRSKQIRNRKLAVLMSAGLLGAMGLATAGTVSAAQPDLDCKLTFSLKGWSAIYQHADGSGPVTCAKGASMPVHIRIRGRRPTGGKRRMHAGQGTFTAGHRT